MNISIKTKSNKKIKLTLDEARELHEQLDELFGVEEVTQYIPYYQRTWPYPQWTYTTGDTTGLPYGSVTTAGNTFLSDDTGMQIKYSAD